MSGVRVEKSCSRSSYIAPVIQGAGKQTEEQDKRHMPVFLCGMFLEAATQSNLDPIHQNLVTKLYKGFWEKAHFSGKSCVWVKIEVLLLMEKR